MEKEKNDLDTRFITFLQKNGIVMVKQLTSGSSGLFSYSSPTYDRRTVYSKKDLIKLIAEGFLIKTDLSWWVFNMIWTSLSE